MSTLTLEAEPTAVDVRVDDEKLVVALADGRVLSVPLDWYPRLSHANRQERDNWRMLGDGYAIEWPDLDEHIGIEGLLAGRRSGESVRSFQKWLQARQ
jgi:hypothetical protein